MYQHIPPIDADLQLNASHTKTADYTGDWLDLGAGFETNGIGIPVAAVVDVSACDRANSDEVYNFKLQETGPDANGAADSAAAADIGATYAVSVLGATATLGVLLVKGLVTKRFVRLALDVSGTSPSVTYDAHLSRG